MINILKIHDNRRRRICTFKYKRFNKQILHIMINSNIEYCEKQEDEDINKYKHVFSTVLNKHKVYSPTFKTLQKNIEYVIKHISN